MPLAHFLNAPTYRRRHRGSAETHRLRNRGDHQELLILIRIQKARGYFGILLLFAAQATHHTSYRNFAWVDVPDAPPGLVPHFL